MTICGGAAGWLLSLSLMLLVQIVSTTQASVHLPPAAAAAAYQQGRQARCLGARVAYRIARTWQA